MSIDKQSHKGHQKLTVFLTDTKEEHEKRLRHIHIRTFAHFSSLRFNGYIAVEGEVLYDISIIDYESAIGTLIEENPDNNNNTFKMKYLFFKTFAKNE